MSSFTSINQRFSNIINGSNQSERIDGTLGRDNINGKGGFDLIFGFFGDDQISGGAGTDQLFGGFGHDVIVGNTGNDQMFGGLGNDHMVWNNGDGSDLMDGGQGNDLARVNFDTDLVNDDLQNNDVAEFGVTDNGVQFARTELNGQTERGLFELDIRNTETLETNFGGGDDTAVIVDNVLDRIRLSLDGGDGVDTLDMSQASDGVELNLETGRLEGSFVNGFENVIGTEFDDDITGNSQDNAISGLDGDDEIFGRTGNDSIVGGKGDDVLNGGRDNDTIVWNNGDGSDLMNGGNGDDLVQVNFDTDLVDDDLQNDDVAEFSTTNQGVQFARTELNGQTERGLFELDIRDTETLETNFGGGDDTAVIVDDLLSQILLDLDGGDGADTLDFSQISEAVDVDLSNGVITVLQDEEPLSTEAVEPASAEDSAVNFENVTGTDFDDVIAGDDQDNEINGGDGDDVIRGGAGDDIMRGGEGADIFVFLDDDEGVDVILDFEFGVDQLQFESSDPSVGVAELMSAAQQIGNNIQFSINDAQLVVQDIALSNFVAEDFFIM